MSDDNTKLLEKCNGLHKETDITRLAGTVMSEHGFAGNTDIPRLVFLVLTTSMLERPVSLLIKGPSGAGKSFCLRMGKQFVPADTYEEFEGMSEKAIVYLKDLSLKNRHLIIGEASGMADGSGRSLLRQLLSEGKVRYATVESTDKGIKGAELPTLEGPCGLLMTTTAIGIHPEDESRMLSVNMRETPDQIEAALMAQAEGRSNRFETPELEPWHNLCRYVRSQPTKVLIPFAAQIARHLPKTHDKVKRDFPQVLSLLNASALLHQFTRERSANGEVIADERDYRTVYDLVNKPISEGLAKSVPDNVRRVVEEIEKRTRNHEHSGVSNTMLAEALSRDPSAISRVTTRAVEDGYLRNTNPGQGREASLVVGERKLPASSALPDPDSLFPKAVGFVGRV